MKEKEAAKKKTSAEEKKEGEEEADDKEKPADNAEETEELKMLPIDSEQIKAMANIIDEFNNIVAKNFSVYGQYDDFSFANSRSSEKIEEKLQYFFKTHFSGDF